MSRVTEEDGRSTAQGGTGLRLLRGDSLDLLTRKASQPAGRISGWRDEFLAQLRGDGRRLAGLPRGR